MINTENQRETSIFYVGIYLKYWIDFITLALLYSAGICSKTKLQQHNLMHRINCSIILPVLVISSHMMVHFVPCREGLVAVLALVRETIRKVDVFNVLQQVDLLGRLFVAYCALEHVQTRVVNSVLLHSWKKKGSS